MRDPHEEKKPGALFVDGDKWVRCTHYEEADGYGYDMIELEGSDMLCYSWGWCVKPPADGRCPELEPPEFSTLIRERKALAAFIAVAEEVPELPRSCTVCGGTENTFYVTSEWLWCHEECVEKLPEGYVKDLARKRMKEEQELKEANNE